VAFAPDGRVVVAHAALRSIDIWSRSGERKPVACDCEPASLSGFGSLFRLTERTDSPLWLLDVSREEPRVLFVPARVPHQ
jgi:hypothetical protein